MASAAAESDKSIRQSLTVARVKCLPPALAGPAADEDSESEASCFAVVRQADHAAEEDVSQEATEPVSMELCVPFFRP